MCSLNFPLFLLRKKGDFTTICRILNQIFIYIDRINDFVVRIRSGDVDSRVIRLTLKLLVVTTMVG